MDNMENSFLEGNGIIILILFFIMMMTGWGGAGFGGGFGNAAAQGALTRAEMADGFNTAEIQRNQSDIKDAICHTNQSVLENRYAIGNQVLENRYAAALQAQAQQAQMSSCCCDLKTQIHAEGEATRAMINQQTIDDLKNQLAQAQNVIANTAQTNNLLGALGRWVANPSVNPYTCYGNGFTGFNNGGCGCNGFA